MIPALAGSAAAGVAWWAMAAVTNPVMHWHSLRGALQLGQSVWLVMVTTTLPNIAGLALLDRWMPARVRRLRASWLGIGAVYGLIVLAVGIVVGSALFLWPMLVLAPRAADPGIVGSLFQVRSLYPTAMVGGIVSTGVLILQAR